MAKTEITRTAVVAAARAFLGTPYRHQASLAGAGCDCLGLVRGVWRTLYGGEPEAMPPYTPDAGEVERDEIMLEAAHRHLVPVAVADRLPGDILVFRMRAGRVAKHCAILTGPDTMIHAQTNDHVREVALSGPWLRLAAAAFGFPGVAG